MGYLFNYCEKLLNLPNISIWDTSNVKNICRMFYGCSGLLSVLDISKWDTKMLKICVQCFRDVLQYQNYSQSTNGIYII